MADKDRMVKEVANMKKVEVIYYQTVNFVCPYLKIYFNERILLRRESVKSFDSCRVTKSRDSSNKVSISDPREVT